MNKEIVEIRKLFPVVKNWSYLYNGSIHPCAEPVYKAMQSFLEQWRNEGERSFFSAYESFLELRRKFAKLINAEEDNIAITESTTGAINLAAQIINPQPGKNVIVTDLAFMSNTYPWLVSYPSLEVRFVKSRDGQIYTEDIEAQIDENTAILHICAVTVGSGFRYDLNEIHKISSKHKLTLIVDGAQALGLTDIDVKSIPLDFLATTASKWLLGPAGVGFLYIKDEFLNARPPAAGWLAAANVGDWDVTKCELHPNAMKFQGGIPNLIGVVGALEGLKLIEDIGLGFIEKRVAELTTYLMEKLEGIKGIQIWTPKDLSKRAGIIFFKINKHTELYNKLKKAKIYCGSFLNGIRIDPNFYNTYEELDKFFLIVKKHATDEE